MLRFLLLLTAVHHAHFMSLPVYQCKNDVCSECVLTECDEGLGIFFSRAVCLKNTDCTETDDPKTSPKYYYQCSESLVCRPCEAAKCKAGSLFEDAEGCVARSTCTAAVGIPLSHVPNEPKPKDESEPASVQADTVGVSLARTGSTCTEANKTYAVDEIWMSGQFRLQCMPNGVYKIIGCVSLRTGVQLEVGETSEIDNWEITCSELKGQIVIRERFLKGGAVASTDNLCSVNGENHNIGESWVSGQFKFECNENGYKITGCVSKRFSLVLDIGESKMVENWKISCEKKGTTVFVDETFVNPTGKQDKPKSINFDENRDSLGEGCQDADGKFVKVGDTFIKAQFKFLCRKTGEEIIACISTRTGAELEIGESKVVDGYKLVCQDEGAKIRMTEDFVAKDATGCTVGSKTYDAGETWNTNNIQYRCLGAGSSEVTGCIDKDLNINIAIGELLHINGHDVSCTKSGNSVRYQKTASDGGKATQPASAACTFLDKTFSTGETWVHDHLRYKCADGGYEITGCVSPTVDVELKVGEATTKDGYRITCKEVDGNKVRFEQRPVSTDNAFDDIGGNPERCVHEGVNHEKGESWQHKNFVYKCVTGGSYDIIGCISNKTNAQLRVGQTRVVKGFELSCQRSSTDNLVILRETPLTAAQCTFSDNRKLEIDEIYNDGTFLVKCTTNGVDLISCSTSTGLTIPAGSSVDDDGFRHNCIVDGKGLFKYVPEIIAP